jgi:hypothetical protein
MSTSRFFNLFVALALVVVTALTVHAGIATSNLVNSGTIDSEGARWMAMAEFSARQAQEAARIQRVQEADTARWLALAKAYAPTKNAQPAQPAYDAETARWVALGEFYAKQAQEAQRIQRVQDADAARWTAMAKFYAKLQTKPFISTHKGQNSTDNTLDQQTRDAIQARWLAQHGDTNRTCVLLCGGW